MSIEININKDLMSSNKEWADKIRDLLQKNNIKMINIIGSPGCGKTSLLEAIFSILNNDIRFAVLEGDVETDNDAKRIKKFNIPVIQLITKGGCHLEAKHVYYAILDLPLEKIDILIVENVGNLVCPAEFDLGENAKVAVLSVTEGEDKPIKYPMLFRESRACLLTKIDLLPYLNFDLDKCIDYIKQVNSNMPIFQICAIKREGIKDFISWVKEL